MNGQPCAMRGKTPSRQDTVSAGGETFTVERRYERRKIALNGFRNHGWETGVFPGTNVIYGANAQGKTNLLEAVYMLSTGRPSAPGSTGSWWLRLRLASILADVFSRERQQTIKIDLRPSMQNITVNSVPQTAGELSR